MVGKKVWFNGLATGSRVANGWLCWPGYSGEIFLVMQKQFCAHRGQSKRLGPIRTVEENATIFRQVGGAMLGSPAGNGMSE